MKNCRYFFVFVLALSSTVAKSETFYQAALAKMVSHRVTADVNGLIKGIQLSFRDIDTPEILHNINVAVFPGRDLPVMLTRLESLGENLGGNNLDITIVCNKPIVKLAQENNYVMSNIPGSSTDKCRILEIGYRRPK